MGFRDQQDDPEFFELVRVNRATGERTVLTDRDLYEGRWAADNALRKTLEQNRDPAVTYEVQVAGKAQKKFRAAAFETGRFPALKDPNFKF